ncbi:MULTISPECIES: FtsB family cell division protein [unclassified Psychrobacter]|uniref:FtsB family cell division protein n=1 Tax=unclassified Psychrobacter TaxID=196806 RepID=UPI0018F3EC35|nr:MULTISPECIES: septum formation initiator family protein [unclassified Psychrobacter]
MKYVSQFSLIVFALIVLAGLQYQYWLGENGHFAHKELRKEIDAQQLANDKQIAANELLRTDVHDLKTGLEAVEEHARLDLGLIKPGETFVQMTTAPTTHSSR